MKFEGGSYNLTASDRAIELTALSGPSTFTLYTAASFNAGTTIPIVDPANYISAADTLTIAASGTDTINGSAGATVTTGTPGSKILAISDGVGNWSVQVTKPPEREYDLARDFGAVPATAINTTDCSLSSTTVGSCSTTTFTAADVGDKAVIEAAGTGNAPCITTLTPTGSYPTQAFSLSPACAYSTSGLEIIDGVSVLSNKGMPTSPVGSNYSWGSTQCILGGTIVTQLCGLTPEVMGVVSAAFNPGSSGFTKSKCTGLLNASGATTIAGNVTDLMITASNGVVTGVSVTGYGQYRGWNNATYTYGSSGYVAVPVTPINCGSGATGLTVNIQFGVYIEEMANNENAYSTTSTPMPCSSGTGGTAASTSTSAGDYGTGLTLYCTYHTPWMSAGQDAQAAMINAEIAESTANALGHPFNVTVRGRFLITPFSRSLPANAPYLRRPAS